jgi:hypothetical protein
MFNISMNFVVQVTIFQYVLICVYFSQKYFKTNNINVSFLQSKQKHQKMFFTVWFIFAISLTDVLNTLKNLIWNLPFTLNSVMSPPASTKSCPTTRHAGAWGERRNSSKSFLASAIDGGERSASRPGRALSRGNDPRYPLYRRLGGPQSRSGHRD